MEIAQIMLFEKIFKSLSTSVYTYNNYLGNIASVSWWYYKKVLWMQIEKDRIRTLGPRGYPSHRASPSFTSYVAILSFWRDP